MAGVKNEESDNIFVPLYMNGLYGRMLYLPAKKTAPNRQILMLYGRRATLEHYYPLAEKMTVYGTVTMPDLPGFGGMESFYKIGEKPTLDNLVGYLAAFIKLRYKKRRLTIVGFGFGFVVATRMLQKYPDIAKKVDLVVSVVGFTRRDDLTFSQRQYYAFRFLTWLGSRRTPAWAARQIILRPSILRVAYRFLGHYDPRLRLLPPNKRKSRVAAEIKRWHAGDFRTYALASLEALQADLTRKQLAMPVHHIAFKDDMVLDNAVIEQHMRIVFTDYTVYYAAEIGYYYEQDIPDIRSFLKAALDHSGL